MRATVMYGANDVRVETSKNLLSATVGNVMNVVVAIIAALDTPLYQDARAEPSV